MTTKKRLSEQREMDEPDITDTEEIIAALDSARMALFDKCESLRRENESLKKNELLAQGVLANLDPMLRKERLAAFNEVVKNCPFCGSVGVKYQASVGVRVVCDNYKCITVGSVAKPEEWNSRPGEDAIRLAAFNRAIEIVRERSEECTKSRRLAYYWWALDVEIILALEAERDK